MATLLVQVTSIITLSHETVLKDKHSALFYLSIGVKSTCRKYYFFKHVFRVVSCVRAIVCNKNWKYLPNKQAPWNVELRQVDEKGTKAR